VDWINEVYDRHRTTLLGLAAVGLVTFVIAAFVSPERAWANLLVVNYYFVSLALFGVVFVALNYVLSAGWAVVFRRAPEAMSAYLPLGAALMLALFFGRAHLYPWGVPGGLAGDPHLAHKSAYLNAPFVFLRMAVAFAIWVLFAHLLRHYSKRQDVDGNERHTHANKIRAVVFLLLFGVTFIFSSIDWIMSLEPAWYSTIFPVYCFAGVLLGGTAAMAVILIYMQRGNVIPGMTNDHLYELARIICATSTFWAYIWFSQYMLIYYANITEEAVYYVTRLTGGWMILFVLNPVLNWLIPLVMLIPGSARRSPKWLLRACAIVLLGRWLDIFLLVMPASGRRPQFGLVEILTFAGILALFILTFLRSFRSAGPVPKQDPYLVESLHLRV